MSRLADRLKTDLKKSKEYRHGYADEFLNEYIATQIKVLREQRDWTQEALATRSGMKQPRIAVLENVNHSAWKISTLRRVAEAFDLTLCVSFEEFGKRLNDFDRFNREGLERFSFDDDPAFVEQPIHAHQPSALLLALEESSRTTSKQEEAEDTNIQRAIAAAAFDGVVNSSIYRDELDKLSQSNKAPQKAIKEDDAHRRRFTQKQSSTLQQVAGYTGYI